MLEYKRFKKDIFSIDEHSFEATCLDVFQYQYLNNTAYNTYCNHLGCKPEAIQSINQIPFLPIDFFKTSLVQTSQWNPVKTFLSSGTTLGNRSKHLVRDEDFYHQVAKYHFESRYGRLEQYRICALLPSYQEQPSSSLISMVDYFMSLSAVGSRYYLNNYKELIEDTSNSDKPTLLIGVSFALLDLIDHDGRIQSNNLIILETGGMKGRRKEIIRQELHEQLISGLGQHSIHSEYGMTELTSQAYYQGDEFVLPAWSKVLIRDINDPFSYQEHGKTGGINIIDLANIDTCAFIETRDLGRKTSKNGFDVLGRFDNSDIRGCNLLV